MDILWSALYQVVSLGFQIYILIVLARVLLSWVNPDPYNPIVRFLYRATDPVLDWISGGLPFLRAGGFDFTPIVLLLALSVLQQAALQLIVRLARGGF